MQQNQTRKTEGPPKPRLVLRFGISGHRTLGDADAHRIGQSLASLFGQARSTLQDIGANHRDLFGDGTELRLISPLAEGSDRIAARAALANGFTLDCPLPFARALYEADFETQASRQAFHDLLARAANVLELEEVRGIDDDRAYESVGLMTLRQCDILVAVWNGKPAGGRGGTAEIVSRAIQSNIPVIWISSDTDTAPRLLRPAPAGVRDPLQMPSEDLSAAAFELLLRTMVLPPADPRRRVVRPPSRRLRDYWGEKQVRFTLTIFYALLQGLVFIRAPRWSDFRVTDYRASVREQWREYWHLLPPVSANTRERLETILEPAFGWADGLASYYVRLYRSSYVLSFMLASAAVFISLLGLWNIVEHGLLFFSEFAVMVFIICIVGFGIARGWHDRWIDYRHLAEVLRHMRVLMFTGSSTLEIRQLTHTDEAAGDSGAAWVGWYYAAIVRDLGMVGACADGVYARSVAQLVQKTELREQMKYHHATEGIAHKLERRLDLAGRTLFGITALICLGFFTAYLFGQITESRATAEIFLTSLLPAFGAALYGIREQGEFGRVARRARHMEEQLSQISKALEVDLAKDAMSLARISSLTEMAAHAMVLDVTDWRFVFRDKPLTLPA